MFQSFKQLIIAFLASLDYKAKYLAIRNELAATTLKHAQERQELKSKIGDPRYVVEKIFGRGVKYYDPETLSDTSKRSYFNQAQAILNSQAFINTKNSIIATHCQEQAKQFNIHQPTNVARDVQMTINALELLQEELESIPDPDQHTKKITESSPIKDYGY